MIELFVRRAPFRLRHEVEDGWAMGSYLEDLDHEDLMSLALGEMSVLGLPALYDPKTTWPDDVYREDLCFMIAKMDRDREDRRMSVN